MRTITRGLAAGVLAFFLVACVSGRAPTTESASSLDAATSAAVTDTARQIFDSLRAAVARLDVPHTAVLYGGGDSFEHAFDGSVMRGRAAYANLLKSVYGGLRGVDAPFDTVTVVPLSRTSAVITAVYHETLTDTLGKKTNDQGVWTNVVMRSPEGWRIVAGHTSHGRAP